jgi:protein TonB
MKTIVSHHRHQKEPPESITHNALLTDRPHYHHHFSANQRQVLLQELITHKRHQSATNHARHTMLFGLGLCLSLLMVIAAFEFPFYDESAKVDLGGNTQHFEETLDVPLTEQVVPPPPKVHSPQIVEVSDHQVIEEIKISLDIEMTEQTKVEEVTISKNLEESMPEEEAEEIFTIVEQQPSPAGGMAAFYDFVGQHLKYPQRASRMGVEGRVFVQFVVEKDGSLTDIQVVKGIGGGCDEEALRVLTMAPDWNPGKQRGRPVRVRMVMPIMFKLFDG